MREVVRYTIACEPRSKKNHLQMVGIGATCPKCGKKERMLPIQSKQYLQYEKDCAWFLKPKPIKPIDFPVNICCTFYMKTKRRVDGLNLLAAIDDILVKHGILLDDGHSALRFHVKRATDVYREINRLNRLRLQKPCTVFFVLQILLRLDW